MTLAEAVKKGIVRGYHLITTKILYPLEYRKYSRKPVDSRKIILLEPRFEHTTDSLLQIKKALAAKGGYEILEMSLGIERLHIKEQYAAARKFIKEMATAACVFTTDSNKVVGGFEKRPETRVVQVWHACGAFKRFGFSTAKLKFGGSKARQSFYPLHRNYDVVTVSSPEVVWAYEEAMGLEGRGQVKPWGTSRTDVFYDEDFIAKAVAGVRSAVPETAGKRVILYAPTFRGHVLEAVSPDELDIAKMKAQLGDEYVLLTKHHPFVLKRPVIPEDCRDFAFDVTEELEIDELLCASDICISDYSSLVFEYSLFSRPIVFFAYDLDGYFDWRGFYYDYDEMTPGPILKETGQVIDYIKHIDERFDPDEVEAFREKFMSACDGHATERILNNVL